MGWMQKVGMSRVVDGKFPMPSQKAKTLGGGMAGAPAATEAKRQAVTRNGNLAASMLTQGWNDESTVRKKKLSGR